MTAAAAIERPATSDNRNKASMLIATVARMGVGLATFVLLARYLGPTQFGLIATAMAYSTFIGIATDFGLATYALRTASADVAQTGRIVGEALAVKALLTVVLAVIGAVALAAMMPPSLAIIYALVFTGTLAASFADLALVAARANRRFDIEARMVTCASVVWLAIVGGVAAATHDVMACAIAFCISRSGYLVAIFAALRRWLGRADLLDHRFEALRRTMRLASSYAADNILTTLSGQIDVLIFGAALSRYDMGIYQAGARLVQAIVPFAVVLSTVYLPAMSAAVAHGNEEEWQSKSRRVTIEFTGLAVLGGLAFAIVGPILTAFVYGPRYAALGPLWPAFATFVILRFAAAGYGIQLVALGRIRQRIVSQIAAIGLFLAAAALLLPRYGLSIAPWLLALSSLPSLLVLGGALVTSGRVGSTVPRTILVALAASAAMVAAARLL